jgi:caffeoyl-CoA O-methyltransferase
VTATPLEVYAEDLFVREDPLLQELRAEMEARGLPSIHVPARTGLLLQILVRATRARRIVEVGTLGGYSALWMARALPEGGRLVTLERDPDRASLAREFAERAGLGEAVDVREGLALDLLKQMEGEGVVDLLFLDADKESYIRYLAEARRLLRPGGLLVADNAFWKGKVLQEPEADDEPTRGIRAFNRALAEDPAFTATIVPTGDGVAVAVRR